MQQRGHAAGGVDDVKLLFDPDGDFLGREIQVSLYVQVQCGQLRVVERTVAAVVLDLQQAGQTALLIAAE
jgi:hypothetical protein